MVSKGVAVLATSLNAEGLLCSPPLAWVSEGYRRG